MKVLLFGATGMVGQGVLRECLDAEDVESVMILGRTSTDKKHPKLQEVVQTDLLDYSAVESKLQNLDACFFCLGVSSSGMSEADYYHITYEITLAAARTLARLNPQMTFVYVSGAGTDSTGRGRIMWARVKGKTENDLLRLPFKAIYMFRPGFIQPLHGAQSKTTSYRVFYSILKPFFPILRILLPRQFLTTETIGKAMLAVARHDFNKAALEPIDINAVSKLVIDRFTRARVNR